jgi:hypothetical protein
MKRGCVVLPNGLELSEGSLECLPFGLERARALFLFSGGPGGPIRLSEAFRLFDPDASDNDDMVGSNLDWVLVLVAYGVRQTPRRL